MVVTGDWWNVSPLLDQSQWPAFISSSIKTWVTLGNARVRESEVRGHTPSRSHPFRIEVGLIPSEMQRLVKNHICDKSLARVAPDTSGLSDFSI